MRFQGLRLIRSSFILDKPQLWLRLGQNLKEDQIKVEMICKNEIKYN